VLSSIFGDDFKPQNSTSTVMTIRLESLVTQDSTNSETSAQLEIYFPPGNSLSLPCFNLVSSPRVIYWLFRLSVSLQ
jgi:hypothetical protein